MKKMILYKGQSQYGALRIHIDQLADAFKILGYEPIVIDLLESDAITKIEKVLTEGCLFAFSFNGMGIDLKVGEESVYDIVNIPYIAALVDHPHYHISRLNTKMNNLIVTCLDRSHLRFLSYYFEPNHMKVKAFLLPGGNIKEKLFDEDIDTFLKDRNIPLLFTGTFRGVPQKTWNNIPITLEKILDDVCDYTLSKDYIPTEKAFDYVLKQRNLEFGEDHEKRIRVYCLQTVGRYIEGYRRFKCIETLGNAGIPIEIYGNGWEALASKWKSLKYYNPGTVNETLGLLRKSRICLNTNNNFVDGGHERVFNAMINGTVVITDSSLYYNEEFTDEENILMYSWSNLEELPEKILRINRQPEKLWQIAKAGKNKADKKHTWINRAKEIIKLVELAQL